MAVFVIDKKKTPLIPCSEKRARLLLDREQAVVHRLEPFTIRLKERVGGEVQPVRFKIDPGSKATGVALVREAAQKQHVLFLAEITHRGGAIKKALQQCAGYRRIPRGYLVHQKHVLGFATGDLVRAEVLAGRKQGIHVGRVAVRATGSFNIQTPYGVVQGISHRHCRCLHRADGYGYSHQSGATARAEASHSSRTLAARAGCGYPVET